jgi:ADP-heptose:LPS heptosyltransferase
VVKSLEKQGIVTVVIGGPEDRSDGDLIASGTGSLNLAGATSLDETAAIIARSRLLLSGDSGVLHIGVGVGIPTVSLFGPGIAAKWAPQGDRHFVIQTGSECSPCTRFGTTPPCPFGVKCLAGIDPATVTEAVCSLLAKG